MSWRIGSDQNDNI